MLKRNFCNWTSNYCDIKRKLILKVNNGGYVLNVLLWGRNIKTFLCNTVVISIYHYMRWKVLSHYINAYTVILWLCSKLSLRNHKKPLFQSYSWNTFIYSLLIQSEFDFQGVFKLHIQVGVTTLSFKIKCVNLVIQN